MTWGIIPAAGLGSRIQPLAFSKELLPVGSRRDGEAERPRAVSEYLVDRMIAGGATKICMVISPGKSDIIGYYGGGIDNVHICYAIQPRPGGLCDAIFRAAPLIDPREQVLVGLPDTIWFPADGYRRLGPAGAEPELAFLTFPVARPELFDAVIAGADGRVLEIQVKDPAPRSNRIWGAFRLGGRVLHELHELWQTREPRDAYLGTLVNEWIARGGRAVAVAAGEAYVDVGTINGYREAINLLHSNREDPIDRSRHALE